MRPVNDGGLATCGTRPNFRAPRGSSGAPRAGARSSRRWLRQPRRAPWRPARCGGTRSRHDPRRGGARLPQSDDHHDGAHVCQAGRTIRPGIPRIAFGTHHAIQPEFPWIEPRIPDGLPTAAETVAWLQASSAPFAERAARTCAVPLIGQAASRSYSCVSPPSTGRLTMRPMFAGLARARSSGTCSWSA